jgi:hypothetical protein
MVFICQDKGVGINAALLDNYSDDFGGVQVSCFNNSKKMKGLQVGLVNKSEHLRGIQLGLWNVNEKRKLPLINWNFKAKNKKS